MRKIWDIHGGIHPNENKTQSLSEPILPSAIPPYLYVPLSQHIGAAAKPIVQVGDKVLKGQTIASANAAVSVPVHAPSSGTVFAIENKTVPHPSGIDDLCIVIETDGLDQWRERKAVQDFNLFNDDELLSIIRNAGIAGMGGAGFPAAIKLKSSDSKPIDTLIMNGTECEPYITADHSLMLEQANDIATGLAILAKIIKPKTILFGIEDNKLDVVSGIEAALNRIDFSAHSGCTTDVRVVTFPTKYPSGGEKQLIEILTGKQVPSRGLPADIGIVCHNIGTAVAIKEAVCQDQPLISRITTVTGEAVNRPRNYHVLIGTPVSFLLEQSQYQADLNNRLIMGGPMMGFALADISAPIIKTSNCILAPTEAELPTPPPAQACIRCGMCAEACPASLLPQQLYWFSQGKELEKLEQHNIADCIECGACSYVCPSNIPLVQYYRASKTDIKQREIDHHNAELAKRRFDARQDRLIRLEQEKNAAKQARQAARKKTSPPNEKLPTASASAANADAPATTVKAEHDATVKAAIERTKIKKATLSEATDDPVARAQAKREAQLAQDQSDPEAKLRRALESAQQRLEKLQVKLAAAKDSDDPNVNILEAGLEKAQSKLLSSQQALDDYKNASLSND